MEIEIVDGQIRIWEWCEESQDYVVTIFDTDDSDNLADAKEFILDHIDMMANL